MINLLKCNEIIPNSLEAEAYCAIYTGQISSGEDRTSQLFDCIIKNTCHATAVEFKPNDNILMIGDDALKIPAIRNLKLDKKKILLDATSLGVVEILYMMLILHNSKVKFDIIYAEPSKYSESHASDLLQDTYFDMSEGVVMAKPLPLFHGYTDRSTIVVSLGFEGHRYGSLLEADEYEYAKINALLGVPAFQAGWENHTLTSNIHSISRAGSRSKYSITAANDPYSTYEVVQKIYKALNYDNENSLQSGSLVLAPFGTKPMSIAMAWFAINNDDVGMLYDFVKKKPSWSSGLGKVHRWSFSAN